MMAAAEANNQGPKTLPWQPEFPSVKVQQSDANAWEGDLLAILVPEEAFKTDDGADCSHCSLGVVTYSCSQADTHYTVISEPLVQHEAEVTQPGRSGQVHVQMVYTICIRQNSVDLCTGHRTIHNLQDSHQPKVPLRHSIRNTRAYSRSSAR